MKIEVSHGEIVDRASVLAIKFLKLGEPAKTLVGIEARELRAAMESFGITIADAVYEKLFEVNGELWDAIARQEEILKYGDETDPEFAKVSAKVVRLNRKRYDLKKAVDELTLSRLREFKQE